MSKAINVFLSLALVALVSGEAVGREVYLDKLDKELDTQYNVYDEMCRGSAGGSNVSNYGCDKRNEVSEKIKAMGCRNIYPSQNPSDTSYWKCRGR